MPFRPSTNSALACLALLLLAGLPASAQTVDVSVGELESGDSITIELLVTVDSPVPPGTTQVANQGTVSGDNISPAVLTDDPAVGGAADLTVTPLNVQVDLQVSKTESIDPVIAGSGADNLTYTVSVHNNSLYAATGVVLSEALTLPAGVTLSSVAPSQGAFVDPNWSVGTLLPGASATLTVKLTVGASAAAGTGTLCDTATVTAANEALVSTGDDSATECTSIARRVDLQVSKVESADPVVAGSAAGNLSYVVTLTNAGPSDSSNVTLSEVLTLPAGVAVDSVTPSQGSFLDPTWTLGSLAAGSSQTLTVLLSVGSSTAAGTDVVCDTATVTGASETLISTGDDAATECTSVIRQVDLQVSKSESIDPVVAGSGAGNLVYIVTLANAGPSDASGVTLSEALTLPTGVSVASVAPSQGSFTDPTWTAGSLASGASATLTVTLTANASAAAGTDTICNTATVTGANETLISTGDDAATACTSVARQVDLQVSKVESVDPALAGDGAGNLTYVVTATNAGPSDASGVTLSEVLTLPAGVTVDSVTPSTGAFLTPTWTLGSLAATQSATLTVVLTVGATAAPGTDVICDTAQVTGANETLILTGDDSATECTSIVQAADLALTKVDDADPPAPGANLTYTITVENLGPSDATNVVVTDVLPTGVTLVATSGCAEDPAGAPTCTLGSIADGSSDSFTIEVSIDPSPPALLSNTASVTADQGDPDPGNNSDTEETTLDNEPPEVSSVDAIPATDGGELVECETVGRSVSGLAVVFSEAMLDPPGDDSDIDVTNVGSYLLVRPGPDFDFATTACGGAAGDDIAVALDSVAYDAGSHTVTLSLSENLLAEQHRLFVCQSLTDSAGNALDGDGDGGAGGDFERGFRVELYNLFTNGHLDCDLSGWSLSSATAGEVFWSDEDGDGADDSGSAGVTNLVPGIDTSFGLQQCARVSGGFAADLETLLRVDAAPAVTLGVVLGCEFFSTPACPSGGLEEVRPNFQVGDTAGEWLLLQTTVTPPPGALSALCELRLATASGASFDAFVDQARLSQAVIFADGFESGDTAAWTSCLGCPP